MKRITMNTSPKRAVKSSFFYLCLLVFLNACGGGGGNGGGGGGGGGANPPEATYELKGTVSNLAGQVVVNDGNGNTLTITDNGPFDFAPATYRSGDSFHVNVSIQSADRTCRIANGQGQFTDSDITNVEITCRVLSTQSNLCALPEATAGAVYQLSRRSVAFGSGLGAAGYSSFDSDKDGYPELLFGSGKYFDSNNNFIIIEYDDATGDYTSHCQSLTYDTAIRKITSFSNSTLTDASLLVFADGKLEVIHHTTGRVVVSINTGLANINDLMLGDIDNDGENEIVFLTDISVSIYNSESFTLETTLPYGGKAFALGYFTGTSAHQLAINTGIVIEFANNMTSVIWDYQTLGFGDTFVSAGDIDNDGLDEIVAGDRWYNFRTFNADTGGILWEHTASANISTLEALDTNGNGVPEVIYSDAQHGSTYVLNGADATLITSFPNKASGVTNVWVDDLDQDNNLELVWGSGYGTTGGDYLEMADLALNQVDWTSQADESDTYAIAYGDINGDGIPESLYASMDSDSGSDDGIVTAVDNTTGEILWRTLGNTFGGFAFTGIHAFAVADINNDGTNEVLVGTDRLYDGYVYALDGTNGQVISSVALESGSPIYSLKVVDIDGDGDQEILAGGGKEHTGATGIHVYVIDPATFTWESTLPSLGNNWNDLWSMDTVEWDNDQNLDILAIWNGAYIIDPEINALNRTVAQNYTSLAVTVQQDVYLATDSGVIEQLYSDTTTTVIDTICTGSIHSLEAINNDELAFTCGGRLGIYQISTSSVNWQTEILDPNLGLYDSLRHAYVEGVSTLLMGGRTSYYFTR